MQIHGTLEDHDFSDVLQMLSSSRRSGKLVLTQRAGQGVIVLRQGKVIYAASSSVRETLGHILLCRGLVTEDELTRALDLQREARDECRLGVILVDQGWLSPEQLELAVREQVEKVALELLGWRSGYFRFDELQVADGGEVEIDGRDLLCSDGLSAERLVLERSLKHDEAQRDRALSHPETPRTPAGERPMPELSAPASAPRTNGTTHLSTIVRQSQAPEFTGEITLAILAYAQRIVHRAVLFRSSPLGFWGMGQFGVDPPNGGGTDFVRNLTLPLDQRSVLTEAVVRKALVRGPLDETEANVSLAKSLGGGWPTEIVVAPLIVGGRVLLILYGDNLPSLEPLGPIGDFEGVLLKAGLAMERNSLAKREKHLREHLRSG